MAKAKLKLEALCNFETQMNSQLSVLEMAIKAVGEISNRIQEITKEKTMMQEAIAECARVLAELHRKLSILQQKRNETKRKIQELELEIKEVKQELSALAAMPPTRATRSAVAALKSALKDLENDLKDEKDLLRQINESIQQVNTLIPQVESTRDEARRNAEALEQAKNELENIKNELEPILIQIREQTQSAIQTLPMSQRYINAYLDVNMDYVMAKGSPRVALRETCINSEYAGKTFDYASEYALANEAKVAKERGDQDRLIEEYNVRLGSDGKIIADIDQHTSVAIEFQERSKENLADNKCLVGSNYKPSDTDVDMACDNLRARGYSEEQIATLLETCKPYYDSDGKTLKFIPADLRKMVVKNEFGGKSQYKVSDYLDGGKTRLANWEKLKEKYPDIKYSKINEYGICYPDFSKYEVFSCKFPPVSKDNYNRVNPSASKCLIGDSESGSPDFQKFRQRMVDSGYTQEQVKKLLETHTIHHDEDGVTLRLIPRDLHEACRHNGGAEVVRRKISEL